MLMREFLHLTSDNLDSEMAKFDRTLHDLHFNVRDGISLIRALEVYHSTLPDTNGDTHKPAVAELLERIDKEVLRVTAWRVAAWNTEGEDGTTA